MTNPVRQYSIQNTSFRSLALAAFACGSIGISGAHAAPVFADWDAGEVDGITITIAETITSGTISASAETATDPAFIANYGADYSMLLFGALGIPGNATADLTFSQALPTGSLLFAFDMDFSSETFVISSDIGFLSLIEQGETQAGATSSLPSYDATTGTLVSAFPNASGSNDDEYSLFDAGGVSTLSVQWLLGGASSGSWIAIATPEKVTVSTVPLPAGLPLVLTGLLGLGLIRRRNNR